MFFKVPAYYRSSLRSAVLLGAATLALSQPALAKICSPDPNDPNEIIVSVEADRTKSLWLCEKGQKLEACQQIGHRSVRVSELWTLGLWGLLGKANPFQGNNLGGTIALHVLRDRGSKTCSYVGKGDPIKAYAAGMDKTLRASLSDETKSDVRAAENLVKPEADAPSSVGLPVMLPTIDDLAAGGY